MAESGPFAPPPPPPPRKPGRREAPPVDEETTAAVSAGPPRSTARGPGAQRPATPEQPAVQPESVEEPVVRPRGPGARAPGGRVEAEASNDARMQAHESTRTSLRPSVPSPGLAGPGVSGPGAQPAPARNATKGADARTSTTPERPHPGLTDVSIRDQRENYYVTIAMMLDWLRAHPLKKKRADDPDRSIPMCLWGTRGIGKTQIVRSYCEARGLILKTYHPAHDRDAADIIGEKYINEETKRTEYAKPHWLPDETLARGRIHPTTGEVIKGGVLFIDEINRAANSSVLAGLMQVLGEGSLSQSGWTLPDGWSIICAANPPDIRYDVLKMDEAMVDRLLHFSPGADLPLWAVWARGNGIHEHVIRWTLQNQGLVQVGETNLPESISPEATLRSLEYFSTLYEPGMPLPMLRVIAMGILGAESAESFLAMITDAEQPVTMQDIASGAYERTFAHWDEIGRADLIRASVDLVISFIAPRQATSVKPAEMDVLVDFLHSLSDDDVTIAIRTMERSAPQWVGTLLDWRGGYLRGRMRHFQYVEVEGMDTSL